MDIVFAEVRVEWRGLLMECEDVVCGFEFGDSNEADLGLVRIVMVECEVRMRIHFCCSCLQL